MSTVFKLEKENQKTVLFVNAMKNVISEIKIFNTQESLIKSQLYLGGIMKVNFDDVEFGVYKVTLESKYNYCSEIISIE